jgi:hypothetical protein
LISVKISHSLLFPNWAATASPLQRLFLLFSFLAFYTFFHRAYFRFSIQVILPNLRRVEYNVTMVLFFFEMQLGRVSVSKKILVEPFNNIYFTKLTEWKNLFVRFIIVLKSLVLVSCNLMIGLFNVNSYLWRFSCKILNLKWEFCRKFYWN